MEDVLRTGDDVLKAMSTDEQVNAPGSTNILNKAQLFVNDSPTAGQTGQKQKAPGIYRWSF